MMWRGIVDQGRLRFGRWDRRAESVEPSEFVDCRLALLSTESVPRFQNRMNSREEIMNAANRTTRCS
jgi:hypothetical protein